MAYHVFFAFSSGLSHPLQAPRGALKRIQDHVANVERTLGITRTKYLDNPEHWDHYAPAFRDGFPDVNDELLCKTVDEHNAFVRGLYKDFAKWAESPVPDGDTITPEDAQGFWPGLETLDVSPHRWTRDYYRARMKSLYEVMRGHESEGVTFEAKALTPKQAAAVISIFSEFLDKYDLRLDVPDGHDYLASSDDGGYSWCSTCGKPKHPDDIGSCRRRNCELKEDLV